MIKLINPTSFRSSRSQLWKSSSSLGWLCWAMPMEWGVYKISVCAYFRNGLLLRRNPNLWEMLLFSLSLGYPSAGTMAKERKKKEVRYSKKQNAHSHEHFIFRNTHLSWMQYTLEHILQIHYQMSCRSLCIDNCTQMWLVKSCTYVYEAFQCVCKANKDVPSWQLQMPQSPQH